MSFPSNGTEGQGYLALPSSGSGPGVVVLQEWWGLNDQIQEVCDRFASEGFVALAPDIYRGESTAEPDEAAKMMMALNIEQAAKDMAGAIDFLRAHPAVTSNGLGVVGYCMGGGLALWLATAAVSAILIGIEMVARTRRMHSGLADEMIHAATEQFIPAGVAGALLTVVLFRFAPQSLWMLPGLWQIVFSLGFLASCRLLPRPMFAVGVWYLAAGLTSLVLASGAYAFSPWVMAIPFGVGQLSMAAILYWSAGENRVGELDAEG